MLYGGSQFGATTSLLQLWKFSVVCAVLHFCASKHFSEFSSVRTVLTQLFDTYRKKGNGVARNQNFEELNQLISRETRRFRGAVFGGRQTVCRKATLEMLDEWKTNG